MLNIYNCCGNILPKWIKKQLSFLKRTPKFWRVVLITFNYCIFLAYLLGHIAPLFTYLSHEEYHFP